MDVEFSDEQEQLRSSVRAFLAAHPAARPEPADTTRWRPDATWAGLAELGVLGLLVPEGAGGGGEGLVTMAVVLEELGRARHDAPVLASAVSAVLAVRDLADGDRATDLLPRLASGAATGGLAVDHSRPWSGDPTVAAEGAGEHAPTLTGAVPWVPHAPGADLFVVVARGPDGLVLVDVDRDAPGVVVEPHDHVDASRSFATVRFDRAPARLLGAPTATEVRATLDRVLVAWVADGVGAAEGALTTTVEYAKQRHQFGVAIGSFQSVQHLCADMLRDVEVTRAATYYGLWAADGDDPVELHRAALMAAAIAAESLPRVGADAIQVHGGIGFTWEHGIHRFTTRLLTLERLFGGADAHLDELARVALPLPR